MKFYLPNLLVLFFVTTSLFSQEVSWGVIDPADLKMTTYAPDTSAAAVVLMDRGTIRLDFSDSDPQAILRYHKRIKILKKTGLEEGDITIPYNENYQRLRQFRVQTIAPNGQSKAVVKQDIFNEELENGWKLRKTSAPNLAVGSIVEIQYTLYSQTVTTLFDWYFQTDIPVRRSELEIYIPDWLNYIFLIENQKLLKENKADVFFEDMVNYKQVNVNYRYFAADTLPAIKEEAYVTNIDDHKLSVQFQLFEYAPPSGGYFKYLDDWQTTAKELLEDADLGRQFIKKNYAKNLRNRAIELTRSVNDANEKLDIIYRFLQQKIEWNGRYRLYAQTKLDDNFAKGKANSGELNMMAIAMLNSIGILAEPVLISTRSHGKPIVDYPIVNQFNHLIVLVEIDGKDILLDLTNPYSPVDFIGVEALNGKGFLLNAAEPQWVTINPKTSKDVIAANLELSPNGQLAGEVKTRCKGYSAVSERKILAKQPTGNFWLERIGEQFTDVEISDMQFQNAVDLDQPLTNSFQIEINDAAQVLNDFIYLNPTLYSNFLENPFKLETREYPVEIPYPFQQQTIINIKIPIDYEVVELPEPAKMVLPEGGGQLLYSITEKDGTIQVNTRIDVRQLIHEPHEYPALKTFFDLIIEKQGEQIVLKKK